MFKWMIGKGSFPYWLGGLALALPLFYSYLVLGIYLRFGTAIIIGIISQVCYLTSISMVTTKQEIEIRQLKEQLKRQ